VTRPTAHPRHANLPEIKVSGLNACRALFEARRDDIRKVYVAEETIPFVSDLLRWCAQSRIAYKIVTKDDLLALTDTPHHDGICLLARLLPTPTFDALLTQLTKSNDDTPLVVLEDVKNPHNLGAILRVCAHFGVQHVLAAGETPELSPAAMRTSEGGAEHVAVVHIGDGKNAIKRLKTLGFAVVATSSHTDTPLTDTRLPKKLVVLFGSEGAGLSRALLDLADLHVLIPGSGALESLNVACASSVILWEVWRSRAASGEKRAPREQVREASPARERAGPRANDDVTRARRNPGAAKRGRGSSPRRRD
jgi:TrmH RNA methyltransferase